MSLGDGLSSGTMSLGMVVTGDVIVWDLHAVGGNAMPSAISSSTDALGDSPLHILYLA